MGSETPDECEADSLHRAASLEEIDTGDRLLVEIAGLEIVLFNLDGEIHAIGNYCVHQSGPLGEGFVSGTISADVNGDGWEYSYECDGEFVSCPWHGWQFDIKTGEHLSDDENRIPTFETVIRDGEVYVEL
jgi:nitrite reductase/ring-hydroxylating ferredoxin subunit